MELGIQAAVRDVSNALSFLPNWAISDIILILAIAVSLGLFALLARVTRRALATRPFLGSWLNRTRGPFRLAFVTIAIALVLPAVSFNAEVAESLGALLRIVFVLLLGWMALIAVDITAAVYLARFRLDSEDNQLARKHVTQVRVLKRVISTIVVVITVGAALMTFDAVRQIGISLFASAGLAGIVVGLAARPVLSNLIAGLQLAMTQPIRIEDSVVVENESGAIEEITSTYVVVRLWDLRRMVVPLSYFIEKPFQNWTREGSALLGTVLLYLDYAAPIEAIRAKAEEIVAQSKLWDGKVIKVQVTDARERTLEVRVLLSAGNAGAAFDLRCEVREKLIAFLLAEYPHALPRERAELMLRDARESTTQTQGLSAGPAAPGAAEGRG
jgi:small-conductance mechanosensitive channel